MRRSRGRRARSPGSDQVNTWHKQTQPDVRTIWPSHRRAGSWFSRAFRAPCTAIHTVTRFEKVLATSAMKWLNW
jgi:hypothetical protein